MPTRTTAVGRPRSPDKVRRLYGAPWRREWVARNRAASVHPTGASKQLGQSNSSTAGKCQPNHCQHEK